MSYMYRTLCTSNIRLLTLLPGCVHDKINITLELVELTPGDKPNYEALSYTWGSSGADTELHVFQDGESKTLTITQNLAIALQHLRNEHQSRRLWIDAVCINQEDVGERNSQVARMADIFRSAAKVIVWLGPESEQSALALHGIDELASKIHVDWESYSIQPSSNNPTDGQWADVGKDVIFDDITYASIVRLLNRPWFERLWVWQEVFLAEDRADLVCGHECIEWTSFRKAILLLYRRRKPNNIDKLTESVTRAFQIANSSDQPGLMTILRRTKGCKCTDQRDRIYAILNLVKMQERVHIRPDYSKSTREVFEEVVLKSIFEAGRLSVITACEIHTTKLVELPSWVPDWTNARLCNPIWNPKACHNSFAHVQHEGNGVLKAVGVEAATVKATFATQLNNASTPESNVTAGAVRCLYALCDGTEYVRGESMAEALCRTLCANAFSERYEPPDPNHLEFQLTLGNFLKMTESPSEPSKQTLLDSLPYLDGAYAAMFGRVFFTTEAGFIGLAPKAARKGDQVHILLGCQSPMLLRPEDTSTFSVIGECYIHGLMDGEAFLGPLPRNWKRVLRFDRDSQSLWDTFVDRGAGLLQIEDPRLGPLSSEWRIVGHPLEHLYCKYQEEATGAASMFDPRMLPDSLRNLGADLREIRLR